MHPEKSILFACAALAAFALSPAAASAQAQGQQAEYQIPPQPLGKALKQVAATSGVQILFSAADVADKRASGLSGRFTTEEALRRLLAGSGLSYANAGPNVVVVRAGGLQRTSMQRPEPAQPRPPSPAAPAEESASGDVALEEVVVTANRRIESAQDVPVSVAVMSAAAIRASGATDTNSLTGKVPSLSINPTAATLYFLRGVGTTATSNNVEQSVASYIDGVYLYSTWSASVPLSSVERVEVLKGPQGTLFGRNTTGGVIQTITRDPMREPTLEVSAGYGNYDTVTATLYGATKLSDKLGVSLAVDYRDQGKGYGYNPIRQEDTFYKDEISLQGKAVYQPTDSTKLTAFFWYIHHKDGANGGVRIADGSRGIGGYLPQPGFYQSQFNTPNSLNYHSYFGYVRLDQDLGFADLAIISGYRQVKSEFHLDQDQIPLTVVDVTQNLPLHNYSEEIQLLSKPDSPVTWIVGAYYFNAEAQTDPITLVGTGAGPAGRLQYYRTQRSKSLAGFGQASVEVMQGTKLTLGLRYTDETERMVPGATIIPGQPITMSFGGKVDSSGWTGRISLDHQFTDGVMGYVSYNRGLKSGGFTLITTANIPPYRPEKLDAYEAGVKSELFGRRLRLNAAAYFYKFKDIAVARVTTGGIQVGNAAAAELKGIDVDFDAQIAENLQVSGSVGYLDGEYTNFPNAVGFRPNPAGGAANFAFDASGFTTVYSPKWSATLGVKHTIPWDPLESTCRHASLSIL